MVVEEGAERGRDRGIEVLGDALGAVPGVGIPEGLVLAPETAKRGKRSDWNVRKSAIGSDAACPPSRRNV